MATATDVDTFTIDATVIDTFQRCKRQALLSHVWQPMKWRPKHLFLSAFRRAVFNVSNGADARKEAEEAKVLFLSTAASPGLDLPRGAKPYPIAKDWCAMLDTTIRAVARLTLLTLRELPPVELTEGISWQPRAWADDSGQLHRWIAVDSWTEADLYRELHGWPAFGDIAVTECPMMLHVVEIGQMRNGRRASSWARGFRHPTMANLKMHFRKRDGSPLSPEWRPLYLADNRDWKPEDWVEQMAAEGECDRLMRHVTINVPSKETCLDTRQQIAREAEALVQLLGKRPQTVPMSRHACDGWNNPCVYQSVCYSEKTVAIESLGLYKHVKS